MEASGKPCPPACSECSLLLYTRMYTSSEQGDKYNSRHSLYTQLHENHNLHQANVIDHTYIGAQLKTCSSD